MPAISVIIPVYKVEKYLHRCIDSILAQTFSDFELILVDDGSPDNCGAICDDYTMQDHRIRVIHQDNQGQAAARNHGVSLANCEWICFVDSDDLIHPQMLEDLYDTVQKYAVDIAACDAVEANEVPTHFFTPSTSQTVSVQRTDEQGLLTIRENWQYCYWVVWGKLIKRDILLRFPMVQGRVYEDNAIVFRWLYEADQVAYLDVPYYYYQVNKNGTTKGDFSLKFLDYLWALKEQISFYKNKNFNKIKEITMASFLCASLQVLNHCMILPNANVVMHNVRQEMKHILKGYSLNKLPLSTWDRRSIVLKMYPLLGPWINRLDRGKEIIRESGVQGLLNHFFERSPK